MKPHYAKTAKRAAREAVALARKGKPHGAVREALLAARTCGRAAARGDSATASACSDASHAAIEVAFMAYGDATALNDAHAAAVECGRDRDTCFAEIVAHKHALDVLDALRAGRGRMLNRARGRADARTRALRLTGAARARRLSPC